MRLSKEAIQRENNELTTYLPEIWELISKQLSTIVESYDVHLNFHDIIGITYIHEFSLSAVEPYTTHNNSYCTQIKSSPDFFSRCVAQKAKVIEHAIQTQKPFFGQCYKGYAEYDFPVIINKQLVCLLCIGNLDKAMSEKSEFLKDIYTLIHLIENAYHEYRSIIQLPNSSMINPSSLKNKHLVRSTLNYINNNYHLDINLTILAQNSFINPSYLSSLFKKTLGIGIVDYISKVRIDHSKFYLKNADLTITQISQTIGFNDPAYFSRVFKKYEGISPNQYRNTQRLVY